MFVDVPVVHPVHVSVVQVIGVIAMRDCEMAAVRSVLVVVLLVSRVHSCLLESVCAEPMGRFAPFIAAKPPLIDANSVRALRIKGSCTDSSMTAHTPNGWSWKRCRSTRLQCACVEQLFDLF
jgi:hypothetical protein